MNLNNFIFNPKNTLNSSKLKIKLNIKKITGCDLFFLTLLKAQQFLSDFLLQDEPFNTKIDHFVSIM